MKKENWGLEKFYDEAICSYMNGNPKLTTLIEKWSKKLDAILAKHSQEKVEKFIVEEILIARREGQPTSRLTSLAVKLGIFKKEDKLK